MEQILFQPLLDLAEVFSPYRKWHGSSQTGGATVDKPSEVMAFSLSVSELG